MEQAQLGGMSASGAPEHLTSADPADWPVAPGWKPLTDAFWVGEAGRKLLGFLRRRLAEGAVIFPPQPLRALELTPPEEVRVVILGQDPYHRPGQAEGLAFSVAPGVPLPPSLRNIFKEGQRDLGIAPPEFPLPGGSLLRWASDGVLLLNTCLTVEEGRPASHAGQGWEVLTDGVVKAIASSAKPVVFLLWGAHAQAKRGLIAAGGKQDAHLVLTANHPSPLSALRAPAPFLGCGHFGLANIFLQQYGDLPIAW
jgi:uracil-DNA glycosylase